MTLCDEVLNLMETSALTNRSFHPQRHVDVPNKDPKHHVLPQETEKELEGQRKKLKKDKKVNKDRENKV